MTEVSWISPAPEDAQTFKIRKLKITSLRKLEDQIPSRSTVASPAMRSTWSRNQLPRSFPCCPANIDFNQSSPSGH